MAKVSTYFHSFNVGLHDSTALTRVDLERMRLAAEVQTNFLCRATGPAFLRPGTEYITTTADNSRAVLKEFIFGVSDAALMEFTSQRMRVMVNDTIISRPSVSSTVTNGDFSDATGWNTTGTGGGTATISGGFLVLNGTTVEGVAKCSRSVSTSDPGTEHALRIVVDRGPVFFRCGSTAGGDQYISETSLATGEHSLAFTPTSGTYYVYFYSKARVNRRVNSIQVESSGVMELPTPWTLSDLPNIRIAQSADVCFVACRGRQQRRIERRGTRSWSVCLYQVDDGPFAINSNPRVLLRPDELEGNGTLTATASYFTPDHVGSLFRISHTGQRVVQSLASSDTSTDYIRISGVNPVGSTDNDRDFTVTVSGTWSGTLTLERSYNDPLTGYVPVTTYTSNGTYGVSDKESNVIYYYRVRFRPGDFTSGTATVSISYDGGGGAGICRVTGFTDDQTVSIEILRPMKNTVRSRDWQPGEWSNYAGWPSAVGLSDGRLFWSGADRIWGSVSDAFASFDEDTEGDSGPISRSIATGGVNDTQWLMSLQRLVVGTEGSTSTVKSSSLDEPLTPTNFGIRDSSTTGAAGVDPIKVDTRGIFVERAGTSLMEMTFSGDFSDYVVTEISKLTTEVFSSGIRSMALQRRPDTRIWIVMENGSCVCMVYEPEDEVLAFVPIDTTGGAFESVAVLPSLEQDRVYFSIRRTIDGNTRRYIEKMAMDREVKPGNLCKVMDSFIVKTGSSSTTVSGLSHLVGRTVVAWGDGHPIETSPGVRAEFTVSGGGTITLPFAHTDVVVGLTYRARWKSARLAYGAQGTAMLQKKTVTGLGLIMTDSVRSGIKYGNSFDDPYQTLYPLPQQVDGTLPAYIGNGVIRDEQLMPFPGEWTMDSRVCIEVPSPYPCTLLGLVLQVQTNET